MAAFHHIFIAPSDFDKSLTFYRDTLGFHVLAEWGGPAQGNSPRGTTLQSLGGFQVVIAEEHDADDRSWSHGVNGTRPSIHLSTANIAGDYDRLRTHSTIAVPLEKTHWGAEWFVIADPDGNLIAFNAAK